MFSVQQNCPPPDSLFYTLRPAVSHCQGIGAGLLLRRAFLALCAFNRYGFAVAASHMTSVMVAAPVRRQGASVPAQARVPGRRSPQYHHTPAATGCRGQCSSPRGATQTTTACQGPEPRLQLPGRPPRPGAASQTGCSIAPVAAAQPVLATSGRRCRMPISAAALPAAAAAARRPSGIRTCQLWRWRHTAGRFRYYLY